MDCGTCTCKGKSNFTLQSSIQQHRNMYIFMKACNEHVRYQLPNKHTCVGYVLDAIEMIDAPPLAAMENVEEDTATNGKSNNFESTAAYLLPKDSVDKRKNNSNKLN